jgi:hypothetical protein
MATVPVDSGTTVHINTSDIPAHVATNLAQALFEAIHREYEDPAVQEDYRRWKAERQRHRETARA